MQLDFDANNIYKAFVKTGKAWAEANAEAEMLEEGRKSVLSELASKSDEKSQAGKEAAALRDHSYRDYITNMVSKRKAANIARVEYDAVKVLAELRRTEAANDRAAMRAS